MTRGNTVRAVLWDLDGTLLPMEVEEFLGRYLPRVSSVLPGQDPREVARAIMAATMDVVNAVNDARSNMEKFEEFFARRVNVPIERAIEAFNSFYERDFHSLGKPYLPDPGALAAVKLAARLGLRQAVATNPIFPMTAILHRISWAGLNAPDFAHITSYENSIACKPHREYFLDVAERLGVPAENCLMVGNDVREDMEPAKAVGMWTFLLDRFAIRNGDEGACDARGDFEALARVMVDLI